jgi:hypothetical protein
MRRLWMCAIGLCLAGLANGSDLQARSPRDLPIITPAEKPTCSAHGTTIDFVDTPSQAASLAKKAGKLVMVLHVSGNFEDPRFT